VVPPVVQSATFFWAEPDDGELRYTRYGNNPNQRGLAEKVAALEGMEAGLVLGSGMAATAMTVLALAGPGSHVLASRRLYGATQTLLRDELSRRGIETTFVDPDDVGDWQAALRPETRVVMVEIPTNPTLRVLDPRPLASLCRARGSTLVCDATFASPVNFRAGAAGVDVVIHSATKYLGGHSDLIAGAVAGPRDVIEEVTRMSHLYGPALDPHAAWLLDRGIRTLEVRMRRHNESALALARWFLEREEVADVIHPGLEHHPDHETAAELLDGFGGMVSVVLRGGAAAADAFTGALRVAAVAPSLGGVETLVSQPRHTSHRGLSPAELTAQGIPDGFVRISVGLEDVEDLKEDFARALAAFR
jgi:cystathionine beta-lyase/cystathionine gamma-synthase